MGVKSTVILSRSEAVERLVDLNTPLARRELRSVYVRYSNEQLETILELMNDADKGGEGFENYTIIGDDQ